MIPHEYIEELTRRVDIVDLVGSYVQLKRKGRLYSGLCPFHSEKTPSFYVYPDTQSFYCFGCGAGGSAVSFMQKMDNISYTCLLYTSPSPRDRTRSRMPSSA